MEGNYWWPEINMLMEYQKTTNLSENTPNPPIKFGTKN